MRHLLGPGNRAALNARLEAMRSGRTLLAFDFDGTLAPVVTARDAATMPASTGELFAQLCEHFPVAVITGRSNADIGPRLGRARVKYVVGNHGLERGGALADFAATTQAAHQKLLERLDPGAGVEVENKGFSLALHYRAAPNKRRARRAIAAALEGWPDALRRVPGKLVVNLVPNGAPNKGQALQALMDDEGAELGLYAGDDVTDEDVFRLAESERLLCVRVGASRRSSAPYYLKNQGEMDALLRLLGALREPSADAGDDAGQPAPAGVAL